MQNKIFKSIGRKTKIVNFYLPLVLTVVVIAAAGIYYFWPKKKFSFQQYAFGIAITGNASPQEVRAMTKDIEKKIIGLEMDSDSRIYESWGLAVDGHPLIQTSPFGQAKSTRLCGVIGYNQNISRESLAEIQSLIGKSNLFTTISFNPPVGPEEMSRRVIQQSKENGCDKVWLVQPGDDLSVSSTDKLNRKFK